MPNSVPEETLRGSECRTAKRPTVLVVLIIVLAAQAAALGYIATCLSPTPDEFANLSAGLSYIRGGDFGLYEVNPPLIKTLAAGCLFLSGAELPEIDLTIARPEFATGKRFAQEGGQNAMKHLIMARWIAIIFVLLGTIGVYLLADELFGISSGLVAAILWTASPLTLAYGPLLTFDISSSAMGVCATVLLVRLSRSCTLLDAVTAGLWTGLAVLTKSSWILLLVWMPVIELLFLWIGSSKRAPNTISRSMRWIALTRLLVPAIAILVINVGYRFQETGTALGAYRFVSQTLSPGRNEDMQSNESSNRFTFGHLHYLPVILPGPFVRGIDLQKRDFETNRPAFRFGVWHTEGVWFYYLFGLAAKLPIGHLFLLVIGVVNCWIDPRARLFLLGTVVAYLFLISAQTAFNTHFRYALIVHGFLCVIGSASLNYSSKLPRMRLCMAIKTLLILSCMFAPVRVFPYCHSFANLLVGGPANNAYLLGGSAADWYQGWLAAATWIRIHEHDDTTIFVYTSRWIVPEVLGLRFVESNIPSAKPDDYFLISVADRLELERTRGPAIVEKERIAILGAGVEVYRVSSVNLSATADRTLLIDGHRTR